MACERVTIDAGHTDVADDQVGQVLGQPDERFLAAARRRYFVAHAPQDRGNRFQEVQLIVYYEQPFSHNLSFRR